MKRVELRKVGREDIFRLADSEKAPLWVRGEYDRSSKKYECYKYDNIGIFVDMRGQRLVYVD